ncbi:MAG TPA: hypothetical protein VMF32_10155 [Xanthobacteraceae bacterium]|nr:hypothetical protein [Xanthobacteraceae bacterium]
MDEWRNRKIVRFCGAALLMGFGPLSTHDAWGACGQVFKNYAIFFNRYSADVGKPALQLAEQAAQVWKDNRTKEVHVTAFNPPGETTVDGQPAADIRIKSIIAALEADGVPSGKIKIGGPNDNCLGYFPPENPHAYRVEVGIE